MQRRALPVRPLHRESLVFPLPQVHPARRRHPLRLAVRRCPPTLKVQSSGTKKKPFVPPVPGK